MTDNKPNKWKPYQRYRLALEQQILLHNMPDFAFYDTTGDAYVFGEWTSSQGNTYGLHISIPEAFPDACPSSYITDPSPLIGRDMPIDDYGNSHDMHCWTSDREGWTKICTYKPESWSADHSIEKVIQKSLLWIEAYESHMSTGRDIAQFLLSVPQ